MPRLSRRKGVACVAHGSRCRLGGGSSFVSPFCRADLPECAVHGRRCRLAGGPVKCEAFCVPVQRLPEEDELAAMVREARVTLRALGDGITEEQAAELLDAEHVEHEAAAAAERRQWERLSVQQADAELTARWAKVSDVLPGPTSWDRLHEAEVEVMARQLRDVHDAARAAEQSQALDRRERHRPIMPATSRNALSAPRTADGPGPDQSPHPKADSAPARRRRSRRPVLTSIDLSPDFGDDYNDPFRE